MATVNEIQAALRLAVADKNVDAIRFLKQDLTAAYEAESRQQDNPIAGMSATERVFANIGAGATNTWQGVKQALLPEALEGQFGAGEADVAEKRQRDDRLANSVEGGRAWQVVGEAAPFAAVPAGVVGRGLTAIPKVGQGLAAMGVGSRVVPTLVAEGGVIGAAAGASMPVGEGESRLFNATVGGAGGAVVPAALGGLGRIYRTTPLPGANALRERAVARTISEGVQNPNQLATQIDRAARAPGLAEVPSTAVITGNPEMAATELAYRAMPEFQSSWTNFDNTANAARWDALDRTLGTQQTVDDAIEATNAYKAAEFPKFLKSVSAKELNRQSIGFEQAVQARLNAAVRDMDPSAQEVYGYIVKAREKGGRYTPQSLWNIRQGLSEWIKGTPPPGFSQVRGEKADQAIMEVRQAIDSMLNESSGQKWGRFLDGMAESLQKETAQKSGLNIRNAFVDQVTQQPRKPLRSSGNPTQAGSPEVTRAALTNAYSNFGKNKFGTTLDWPQEDAVTQVLGDLNRQEQVLGSVTKSTTRGGSQTTPLGARLLKERGGTAGNTAMQIIQDLRQAGEGKQRELINRMLQDPRYASELLRLAADQAAPLTRNQRNAILVAKAAAVSVGANSVND